MTNSKITSLAVDPALKLVRISPQRHLHSHRSPQVAAASGPRLAVWSLSGVSARTWLVHSSLVLPDDQRITAVDCCSGVLVSFIPFTYHCSPYVGLLVVASQSTLSVHTLVMENDLPTWSSKWSCRSLLPLPTRASVDSSVITGRGSYLLSTSLRPWRVLQLCLRYVRNIAILRFTFDPRPASQNSSHNSYDFRPGDSSNSSP